MNRKSYSEKGLSVMIDVATQYIEAPHVRDSIISKCHQGIGLLVASTGAQQEAAINLTREEVRALVSAVQRRRQIRGVRTISG